ncbi:unnamed protein product [Ilex paraguariensis]|uniref:Uncharacterized protein n=1 Tax=Ilex paraguariensis TaxID=185542 RepID=A0ABC8RUI5_9AQUA
MATNISQICKVFGDYVVSSENQLTSIAQRVCYEQDTSTSRRAILAELSKLNGLTMAHRHEVAYKIVSDNIKVDIIFSLLGEERALWVCSILLPNLNVYQGCK